MVAHRPTAGEIPAPPWRQPDGVTRTAVTTR